MSSITNPWKLKLFHAVDNDITFDTQFVLSSHKMLCFSFFTPSVKEES